MQTLYIFEAITTHLNVFFLFKCNLPNTDQEYPSKTQILSSDRKIAAFQAYLAISFTKSKVKGRLTACQNTIFTICHNPAMWPGSVLKTPLVNTIKLK